jgi:LysR family transcriptional regulator, regulator of abg operon
MRLRQLQDFLAAIEEGSIHAAARKLGLSQPAVTKSLRGLEAELQVQLVRRTNHGVEATPAGRAFYTRARAAQAELRKGEEEIAQLAGEGGGSVAFGVGAAAALLIAPEAAIRFNQQRPAASVSIFEGPPGMLLPMVRDGTLDFAVTPKFDAKLDTALAFRPLFREEFIVIGRKNHPLRNAGSIKRLGATTWVGRLRDTSTQSELVRRLFAAAGMPPPRMIAQCDSYNIALSMISKSDALSILGRRLLAASRPASDLLQEIAITERLPTMTIGMFTRKDPPLTPVAAVMAKIVMSVAKQLPIKP